jgi:hypothetical protein
VEINLTSFNYTQLSDLKERTEDIKKQRRRRRSLKHDETLAAQIAHIDR